MLKLKLRTQFLIATLLVIATLTGASLLIIRHTVRSEIDNQVQRSMVASMRAFESVQKQRELQLSRSAAMLAEQPLLKALMTTEHAPTIQDASTSLWKLSGSDLMILTSQTGSILAFHLDGATKADSRVEDYAVGSIKEGRESSWWFHEGGLYWTFLRPVVAGGGSSDRLLGYVILGFKVNDQVADELAHVAASQIILATQRKVIASTLPHQDDAELEKIIAAQPAMMIGKTRDLTIGNEGYAASSVLIQNRPSNPIYCYVLLPLGPSEDFLRRLNITIVVLGIAAVCAAAALITWISRAITKPLDRLVSGVRALSSGDYSYAITPTGSAEVAELSSAFSRMRISLRESQRLRIEAEQHAVVSRTASAISHDLRHYLAAVLANAEFLYDAPSNPTERREIYDEIRIASDQMVDLIDSLRELSNEQAAVTIRPANLDEIAERAIMAVKARPQFKAHEIRLNRFGEMLGAFDERKMERVFFNLILNACEASAQTDAPVEVDLRSEIENFTAEVRDHGTGIPESIRDNVFDPFISVGKENGSGLGLAIVQKIVRDHHGVAEVAETSAKGTCIRLRIPKASAANKTQLESTEKISAGNEF